MRALLAGAIVLVAFAVPFAVVGLAGDDGPTPATAGPAPGFPLERVAEDFDPPARTQVIRGFRAAAPLPALHRQRARRARATRRAPSRSTPSLATRTPRSAPPAAASPPTMSAPAPAPVSAPAPPAPRAPAPAPVRTAPAPAPAPSRPAPDDFDSGESFDSTG